MSSQNPHIEELARQVSELHLLPEDHDKYAALCKIARKSAHDFNNMLGIIIGTGEMLQVANLSPEIKADVDTIIECANRGKALTKNLLQCATQPPLKADGAIKTNPAGSKHDAIILEGKRVLVVEDEPHFVKILKTLLSRFNHKIDFAMNGKMALDHLKDKVYDVVSLDYVLPDMTGMDVYRAIRRTNRDIPIVFVSGNVEFEKTMIGLQLEDTRVDHLAKPFGSIDYVNKINKWLRNNK